MIENYILEFFTQIRNPFLTLFMKNISFLGSFVFIPVLIVGFYIFDKKKEAKILSITYLFSEIISITLKYVFLRPRPSLGLVGVITPSFPSAHTTLAFSSAFVLSKIFNERKKKYFYSLAVMVAISRLYLGAHFLSDVIVGGILGILIGIFIIKCKDRIL